MKSSQSVVKGLSSSMYRTDIRSGDPKYIILYFKNNPLAWVLALKELSL